MVPMLHDSRVPASRFSGGSMILAFALLCLFQASALRLPLLKSRGFIQPVFHNVRMQHVKEIADIIFDRGFCSISLRDADALESLTALCELLEGDSGTCVVGASTVRTIDQLGAGFISTIATDRLLIRHCVANRMPIFSGVRTLEDFETSISFGATFLKVYPSSAVSPAALSSMLKKVDKTVADSTGKPLRTFVSGGVTPQHVLPYLEAGATDFIIGLDAAVLSYGDMKQKLADIDAELRRAQEHLRARTRA